jgi:hypothetical protein
MPMNSAMIAPAQASPVAWMTMTAPYGTVMRTTRSKAGAGPAERAEIVAGEEATVAAVYGNIYQ